GDFELCLAPYASRAAAEAREASTRARVGLAQSLARAGIKGRALERRTASPNKAHDEFEQQEQKADLKSQAEDRQAAAETAEQAMPKEQAEQSGAYEASQRAGAKTAGKKAAL